MRVLLYHQRFPGAEGPFRGGIVKAVHGLAVGLSRRGADVVVLSQRPGAASGTRTPYRVRVASRPEVLASTLRDTRLVAFLRDDFKPEIVVLNGMFHPGVFLMHRLCARLRIPFVFAPHDPYNEEQFAKGGLRKRIYFRTCERRVLGSAALVQLLDPRHAGFLTGFGISTPVVAAPNGYDENDVPSPHGLRWSESGPIRLFYLGRLDAHNKGLDLLIRSVERARERLDIHLTLQGPDHGDRRMLEGLVTSRGLGERVRILAPDFTRSSTDLIREHDVFCLPSRFEGFGLSALEAMLCARVVLVSEVAGISPHVRSAGCGVVSEPSIDGIVSALTMLSDARNAWKPMGLAGREYALETLTWEHAAGLLMPRYREAAHHSPHSMLPSVDAPAVCPSDTIARREQKPQSR